MSLFQLSTPALVVGLFAVIIGATVVGHLVGRSMRDRSEGLREPFGAIQSAMLGFMPEPAPRDVTHDVDRVGVIGLGAMGRPMTEHLIRRPATAVAIHGRDQDRYAELLDAGARWHDTPRSLATDATVVLLMSADDLLTPILAATPLPQIPLRERSAHAVSPGDSPWTRPPR